MQSLITNLLLCCTLTACSGKVENVGASGGGCPSAPPVTGAQCTAPWTSSGGVQGASAHCSWGDDPRPACRTAALCQTDGTWLVTAPTAAACSEPALSSACPSTPPSSGTTCTDATVACWYEDGTRCGCSGCKGGSGYPVCQIVSPPEWSCATPGSGCPTTMPQAGSPCSTPDASCGPDCNLVITCKDGVWQWRAGSCPICAAPDTPIATPTGDRAIAALGIGDLVYSVDDGAIVAVPIVRAGRTPVRNHWVVRVELDSGAVLEISPGHPTADGRSFGDLTAGSRLDMEHEIVAARLVPYEHDATYDILPGSSTGTYFAAGALIGSTLSDRTTLDHVSLP